MQYVRNKKYIKSLSFKFILYILDTQFRVKSVYPERFLVAVHETAGSKSGNRVNLAGSLEAVWGINAIQPRSHGPISPPLCHPVGPIWEPLLQRLPGKLQGHSNTSCGVAFSITYSQGIHCKEITLTVEGESYN